MAQTANRQQRWRQQTKQQTATTTFKAQHMATTTTTTVSGSRRQRQQRPTTTAIGANKQRQPCNKRNRCKRCSLMYITYLGYIWLGNNNMAIICHFAIITNMAFNKPSQQTNKPTVADMTANSHLNNGNISF
jgi:hypothetical protein